MKLYKKIIFVGFIFLFSECQRKEKLFYPNGALKFEVSVDKEGKRDGSSIQYYEDGETQYISFWSNGAKEGESVSYHKNGKVYQESVYVGDEVEGDVLIYDSLGVLVEKLSYKNGLKHGECKMFYPDGTVHVEEFYKNGKCDGLGKYYYENSELHKILYCKNDSLIYYKAYDKNGEYYDSVLPIELTYDESLNELEIALAHTEYDSARIGIIIGSLDESKHLIDTAQIFGSRYLKYKYSLKKDQKSLSGYLMEIKMPKNTIEGEYYFEYFK